MRFLHSIVLSFILFFSSLSLVSVVQAQITGGLGAEMGGQLGAAAQQGAGYSAPVDPRVTVGLIISSVLRLLGTIVLGLIVYAGFLWVTAAGKEEQVGTAKKILKNAVIGLVIIFSSYTITIFVVSTALGGQGGFVQLFLGQAAPNLPYYQSSGNY